LFSNDKASDKFQRDHKANKSFVCVSPLLKLINYKFHQLRAFWQERATDEKSIILPNLQGFPSI